MTFIKNLKKILPYSFKQKCLDLFDSFKINIATNFIPEIGIDDFINKLNRKPKIAFVKQVTATDLYCCSKNASQKEIIFSSFHRSGPVALFTKFNADFYIVNLDSAQECNAWKYNSQEYNGSRSPLAEIEKYINEIISKDTPFGKRILNKYPQSTFALNADSIDWSNYDIVISNFISIPSRITQKHSKVIWCYMPSNPDNKVYKESHKKQLDGYDFLLNYKNIIIKLNQVQKNQ